MEPIIFASFITSFFAGIAALFAPCCIGVLLPAYFGSIFRQRRTVLIMTAVFFLGLLTIFVPLGLGIGAFGELLKEYHNAIYMITGAFLLFLGASLLFGLHFSMPFHTKSKTKITGTKSVFVLGALSGLATLCCAPVLAGALALSLLPGSALLGALYSVIYVLGMILPLFVISYFADKTGVMEKVNLFKKEVTYKLLGRKISVSVSNLISSIIFIVMALVIFYFGIIGQLGMAPSESQLGVNIFMAQITDMFLPLTSQIWFQIMIIAILVGIVLWVAVVLKKRFSTRSHQGKRSKKL